MPNKLAIAALCTMFVFLMAGPPQSSVPKSEPEYTSDSQLRFPDRYRDWIFLSSGFDMSYTQATHTAQHVFDNVFVNPEAYQFFAKHGTWPDKTMLVLEIRRADGKGSINRAGNYQTTSVVNLEVHVKDEARFQGKWAFFSFSDGKTAKMIPQSATCYSCHAAHAAVDTTFVQFYPTLLPIAKASATLSHAYQKETAP